MLGAVSYTRELPRLCLRGDCLMAAVHETPRWSSEDLRLAFMLWTLAGSMVGA